jgi:uncharacterized Zn-binding protein involved in type VI secretion
MRRGVTRTGIDTAGGVLLGHGNTTVYANNFLITVLGDAVSDHGDGKHENAVMVEASPTVFCSEIPVCRLGDKASCGHASTGSNDVFIG